jgi:hypothetical protein
MKNRALCSFNFTVHIPKAGGIVAPGNHTLGQRICHENTVTTCLALLHTALKLLKVDSHND